MRDYVKDLLGRCRVVDGTELDRLDHIKVIRLPWPKTEPDSRPVIAPDAKLHLWDWERCDATPEEIQRAKFDIDNLPKPDRRSDTVEETLVAGGRKGVVPAVGDFLCHSRPGGRT